MNMSSVETPKLPDHNQTGIDYRARLPRPKVHGPVIDAHNHLLAARHAPVWFESARHYGIDLFWTMGPLEEMVIVQREYPGKFHFIAVPNWRLPVFDYDDWMRRIDGFYNIGSRIIKFHMAPGTMALRQVNWETPAIRKIMAEARARGMILMSHMGDPEIWYRGKYAADVAKYGTRDQHYLAWEQALEAYRDWPWLGAHLGGNPEDLPRLQYLLDKFPNLYLDNSATRWIVREISTRRDQAREFMIRNQDRILFGSDQVSEDSRGFDFLSSRWWCHRKLWETACIGQTPILDPDLPANQQPIIRGLALPDDVLQKLYHDNAVKLLGRVGVTFPASI
jgi:predicted TIM-barrel fold metal-dependent hydrolase